jgi:L-ribulose-5-phosphate 4-epimerase
MLEELRQQVLEANLELVRTGLVRLTWGNVSGIDRASGLFVIKPSGVPYGELRAEHLVVLDLAGRVVEGTLRPSSDTPTHRILYAAFPAIGGITHTHSVFATSFAQACREIPCLGTTHADHFNGSVPVARPLTVPEVDQDYEGNTGKAIVECFARREALEMPAVLAAHHGPFTWGKTAMDSVRNSVALETVAEMAAHTLSLNSIAPRIPPHYLHKHYSRKHGPQATYGQGLK